MSLRVFVSCGRSFSAGILAKARPFVVGSLNEFLLRLNYRGNVRRPRFWILPLYNIQASESLISKNVYSVHFL